MSSPDPSFDARRSTPPTRPSRFRGVGSWGLSFSLLAGMVALNACRTQESQAAEASPSAPPPVAAPSAVAAAAVAPVAPAAVAAAPADDPTVVAAAPAFHEETFDLAIKPIGSFAAGKPAEAEIQLTAKGGYHCNDKYPYKFKVKVDESPGLKFDNPIVTKEAVHLETAQARMKVVFTPDSKGEKSLVGTFFFSLCSAERCLVEKRDLAMKFPVD